MPDPMAAGERRATLRMFWGSLTAAQRRTMTMMASAIVALHVIGFGVLVAFVAPHS